MRVALFNRLRKQLHRDIALLQDEVVDVVYSVAPKAVLHGGTAVWRCYQGNRFSDDLDFYASNVSGFKEAFSNELSSRGLQLLKFKKTASTVFSKVSNGSVEVRVEVSSRKPKGVVAASFERADGSFISVFTLSPEELLLEKATAFGNRRLVRDVYDVYLLSNIANHSGKMDSKVCGFLKRARKPLDEKNLRVIVFSGAVPSFEQMLLVLKRRFSC